MKTHQLSEALILEMHKDPKWTERIEKELPELFAIQVGKWYKRSEWPYGEGLWFNDGESGDKYCPHKSYGFSGRSGEFSESCIRNLSGCIPADPKEVEHAFERELVRRYGEDWRNVKIKAHADGDHCNNLGDCYLVIDIEDCQVFNKNGLLFDNGKWAEPLNVMTKEEAEKKFNIVIR